MQVFCPAVREVTTGLPPEPLLFTKTWEVCRADEVVPLAPVGPHLNVQA
jgi:hypothetical protein